MQTTTAIQLYLTVNKVARYYDISDYCEHVHARTQEEIASAFCLLLRNDVIESTPKMAYKLTGK